VLKLRRIELVGFKSFYERAEIVVTDTGVTGVVGPNGCGKSNISDAVAWVLGEQRARSLRGDRMEDVIFSGTRTRSQLGMAEVTITLFDETPPSNNGGPPPGPAELTIQRRLYRSGESRYLLNGRSCRLRDIQDIFLGTGLGPNSYAIIEQGRIGRLLSARPNERRQVIEEAAGVTKFKAKRKLAESRLGAARGNLSRVNDILNEVERQRNSLKRQASKARRYRELKKQLRRVLAAVFSTRADLLIQSQEAIGAALDGMAAEGAKLETQIGELDVLVHRCRTGVESRERSLDETREQHSEAELEHGKAIQRVERLRDQVRSMDQRVEELTGERDRVIREVGTHRQEIAAVRSKLEELEVAASAVKSNLEKGREALEVVNRLRSDEERSIQALRNQQFEIVGQEARITNELSGREEMLRRLESQVIRVQSEEQAAKKLAADCREKMQAAEVEQASRRATIARLVDEKSRADTDYAAVKSEHADAVEAASEARRHEDGIRHRLETIRELSLQRAYGSESVQQFFNNVRNEAWAPLGIAADFIEVDPDYEEAVEDLLHSELQYVVVEHLLHAEKALSLVRNTAGGRLDLLVVGPDHRSSQAALRIDGATRVADVVRMDDRLQCFEAYIADTFVVDDLQRAWELSEAHPGKRFVARTGEVVRDRLISWGERTTHGPLSLKREMRELDRRVELARVESKAASDRVAALEVRIEEIDRERQNLAWRLQEGEKEALSFDHGIQTLRSELDRAGRQLEVAVSELARFAEERRELDLAMVSGRSKLADVEARKTAITERLDSSSKKSEELLGKSEQLGARVGELRSQAAVLAERNQTLMREEAALKARARELDERRIRADRQIEQTKSQRVDALKSIDADELVRHDCSRKRDELDLLIASSVERLDKLRQELHAAESNWDEARTVLDGWKDKHNEREIERTEVDSDMKHLVNLCFSELGEPIESVCLDSFETLTPEELEEHDDEYQQLRQRIESIGSVNMMAVEEYEEAQQRFEFLTTQRQDLLDSIRDTTQAIDEIDVVCRKQFNEAFEQINKRFTTAFVELFGGGHGELRLIEQADVSDAGIEIVAQPPGKKLQNVLLLSGGEKALAALSLLIALFQFKPSPFCVLDEVDAPLDDANIDRFAQMIRTMSETTQFIVITHSKRTMETAKQLYGVTMEEPGVSKVVSVRLN
jgi:chromosome segregation protein